MFEGPDEREFNAAYAACVPQLPQLPTLDAEIGDADCLAEDVRGPQQLYIDPRTFCVDGFTGTLQGSIPLQIPAARGRTTPKVVLRYNTSAKRMSATWSALSAGWDIPVPYLRGCVRRTEKEYEVRDLRIADVVLHDMALRVDEESVRGVCGVRDTQGNSVVCHQHELVPLLTKKPEHVGDFSLYQFGCTTCAVHAYVKLWQHELTGVTHWHITDFTNTTHVFREQPHAKDESERTWVLSEIFDDVGNVTQFAYEDSGECEPTTTPQLSQIRYANGKPFARDEWRYVIKFSYGVDESARSGASAPAIRSLSRLRTLSVFRNPSAARGSAKKVSAQKTHALWAYSFFYDENSPHKELTGVGRTGYGADAMSLEHTPLATFAYQKQALDVRHLHSSDVASLLRDEHATLFWSDVDGTGLPGLVFFDKGDCLYIANNGDGTFAMPRLIEPVDVPAQHTLVQQSAEDAQLLDDIRTRADLSAWGVERVRLHIVDLFGLHTPCVVWSDARTTDSVVHVVTPYERDASTQLSEVHNGIGGRMCAEYALSPLAQLSEDVGGGRNVGDVGGQRTWVVKTLRYFDDISGTQLIQEHEYVHPIKGAENVAVFLQHTLKMTDENSATVGNSAREGAARGREVTSTWYHGGAHMSLAQAPKQPPAQAPMQDNAAAATLYGKVLRQERFLAGNTTRPDVIKEWTYGCTLLQSGTRSMPACWNASLQEHVQSSFGDAATEHTAGHAVAPTKENIEQWCALEFDEFASCTRAALLRYSVDVRTAVQHVTDPCEVYAVRYRHSTESANEFRSHLPLSRTAHAIDVRDALREVHDHADLKKHFFDAEEVARALDIAEKYTSAELLHSLTFRYGEMFMHAALDEKSVLHERLSLVEETTPTQHRCRIFRYTTGSFSLPTQYAVTVQRAEQEKEVTEYSATWTYDNDSLRVVRCTQLYGLAWEIVWQKNDVVPREIRCNNGVNWQLQWSPLRNLSTAMRTQSHTRFSTDVSFHATFQLHAYRQKGMPTELLLRREVVVVDDVTSVDYRGYIDGFGRLCSASRQEVTATVFTETAETARKHEARWRLLFLCIRNIFGSTIAVGGPTLLADALPNARERARASQNKLFLQETMCSAMHESPQCNAAAQNVLHGDTRNILRTATHDMRSAGESSVRKVDVDECTFWHEERTLSQLPLPTTKGRIQAKVGLHLSEMFDAFDANGYVVRLRCGAVGLDEFVWQGDNSTDTTPSVALWSLLSRRRGLSLELVRDALGNITEQHVRIDDDAVAACSAYFSRTIYGDIESIAILSVPDGPLYTYIDALSSDAEGKNARMRFNGDTWLSAVHDDCGRIVSLVLQDESSNDVAQTLHVWEFLYDKSGNYIACVRDQKVQWGKEESPQNIVHDVALDAGRDTVHAFARSTQPVEVLFDRRGRRYEVLRNTADVSTNVRGATQEETTFGYGSRAGVWREMYRVNGSLHHDMLSVENVEVSWSLHAKGAVRADAHMRIPLAYGYLSVQSSDVEGNNELSDETIAELVICDPEGTPLAVVGRAEPSTAAPGRRRSAVRLLDAFPRTASMEPNELAPGDIGFQGLRSDHTRTMWYDGEKWFSAEEITCRMTNNRSFTPGVGKNPAQEQDPAQEFVTPHVTTHNDARMVRVMQRMMQRGMHHGYKL